MKVRDTISPVISPAERAVEMFSQEGTQINCLNVND
jgi:hypothetical protein